MKIIKVTAGNEQEVLRIPQSKREHWQSILWCYAEYHNYKCDIGKGAVTMDCGNGEVRKWLFLGR